MPKAIRVMIVPQAAAKEMIVQTHCIKVRLVLREANRFLTGCTIPAVSMVVMQIPNARRKINDSDCCTIRKVID